jgi:hypothetical protein
MATLNSLYYMATILARLEPYRACLELDEKLELTALFRDVLRRFKDISCRVTLDYLGGVGGSFKLLY